MQGWRFVPAEVVKELIRLAETYGWGEGWSDKMTIWLGPPADPGMDAEVVELRDQDGNLITSMTVSATAAKRRV